MKTNQTTAEAKDLDLGCSLLLWNLYYNLIILKSSLLRLKLFGFLHGIHSRLFLGWVNFLALPEKHFFANHLQNAPVNAGYHWSTKINIKHLYRRLIMWEEELIHHLFKSNQLPLLAKLTPFHSFNCNHQSLDHLPSQYQLQQCQPNYQQNS